MYPNISYVDGIQAAVALSAYCYNNGATYSASMGDPSEGAVQTKSLNTDGQTIGSSTFVDARTGSLNLQYDATTDEAPAATKLFRPTYIVSFRSRFYVTGAAKAAVERNAVIKFTADVTELQNPFVPILLSVLGQQLKETVASGSLPRTVACAASNTRPGATLAYSVETFATPGSAAPTGFTIHATTGVLTIANTVAAGTYDVRVLVSDTVTLADGTTSTVTGWGRYTLTVT